MLMTLEKLQNFTYYAGIMLDAFAILLCSKLCWHNWLKPNQLSFHHTLITYQSTQPVVATPIIVSIQINLTASNSNRYIAMCLFYVKGMFLNLYSFHF